MGFWRRNRLIALQNPGRYRKYDAKLPRALADSHKAGNASEQNSLPTLPVSFYIPVPAQRGSSGHTAWTVVIVRIENMMFMDSFQG